ncbi:hypothetical protein AMTRI_Chr04g187280 [Amborella trichopoda]
MITNISSNSSPILELAATVILISNPPTKLVTRAPHEFDSDEAALSFSPAPEDQKNEGFLFVSVCGSRCWITPEEKNRKTHVEPVVVREIQSFMVGSSSFTFWLETNFTLLVGDVSISPFS